MKPANMAHALDAGLRLSSIRASLGRASDAHRYVTKDHAQDQAA